MVQVFGPSRKDLLKEMIGQSLGKGLSDFSNEYFANRDLEGVLQDKSLQKQPISERLSALEGALRPHGERGQRLLQQRLGIEQQREQEKELARTQQQQQILAKSFRGEELTPEEEGMLPSETQFKRQEINQKKKFGKNVRDSLKAAGYPDETADLWQQQVEGSTVQGLSDIIKEVNKLLSRSDVGKGKIGETEPISTKPNVEIPGVENKSFDLNFPKLVEPVGRTSSDTVKEETEHKKINSPLYAETIDSLNALDEDFRDITQLQEYNATPGALPTGIEKWNVDWETGDLRFKALASPETQSYVKIIARLLGRAKEYFPGRVTNFDLEQFKTRFPTLANSPEGRNLIAKQLSLANRIAYLKDETLKAAVDHYGAGADPQQIRRYAQENYRKIKSELEKDLKQSNQEAEDLLPENQVRVRSAEGQEGTIPKRNLEKATKEGGYVVIQ